MVGQLLGICPFSSLDPEAEPGELPYVPLLPGGAWSSQPQPLEPSLGGQENGNGGLLAPTLLVRNSGARRKLFPFYEEGN